MSENECHTFCYYYYFYYLTSDPLSEKRKKKRCRDYFVVSHSLCAFYRCMSTHVDRQGFRGIKCYNIALVNSSNENRMPS